MEPRDRSFLAVCNAERAERGKPLVKKPSGEFTRMASLYKWRERASASDAEQRRGVEAEWVKRREEQRQTEWDISQKANQKLLQLLNVMELSDDKPQHLTTGNMERIASALERISKVARLAVGLETEREQHELVNYDELAAEFDRRIAGLAKRGGAGGDTGPVQPAPEI